MLMLILRGILYIQDSRSGSRCCSIYSRHWLSYTAYPLLPYHACDTAAATATFTCIIPPRSVPAPAHCLYATLSALRNMTSCSSLRDASVDCHAPALCVLSPKVYKYMLPV